MEDHKNMYLKVYGKANSKIFTQKNLFSTLKFSQYWGISPVLGKSFNICNFPNTGEIRSGLVWSAIA